MLGLLNDRKVTLQNNNSDISLRLFSKMQLFKNAIISQDAGSHTGINDRSWLRLKNELCIMKKAMLHLYMMQFGAN